MSKTDLLLECNKLVRLAPKNEDMERIKKEQRALMEKVQKDYEEPADS